MSGAAANQLTVVATLRLSPPEGMDRWTPALVAKHSRLSGGQASEAIRSLRNAGKIKFGALELSPSMVDADAHTNGEASANPGTRASMARTEAAAVTVGETTPEYLAKAGDEAGTVANSAETPVEPVSRGVGARSPTATSEPMDATAGETAPVSGLAAQAATERLVDLGSVQDGLHKCPRTGRAGVRLVRATVTDADTVVTAGETAPIQETATEPCAHPGYQQGEVAAAGESSPLPDFPGHVDPAVRDTADEAGAPVVRAGVPASSLPAQPGNPLGVELLGEIEAYLARTQMGGMMLGEFAVRHPGYVNLLRKRRTARPQTAFPVREFMERWPQGVTRDEFTAWGHSRAAENAEAYRAASVAAAPGDAGFLADEVKAEALSAGERRHVARKFGGGVGNPLSANVVAVQAVLLAEPEDAFLFLRRKWPELLRGVIAQARATGTTPAAQLAHVIESGLIAAAGSL